jgi:hypothetical protein
VSVVCLAGRGLCDGPITRPEESYRLCCVIVCYLETSRMGRLKSASGLQKPVEGEDYYYYYYLVIPSLLLNYYQHEQVRRSPVNNNNYNNLPTYNILGVME